MLHQHRGTGCHAGRTSHSCLHTGDHTARHGCKAARRQAVRLDALIRPSCRHQKLHGPASVAVHAAAAAAPAAPTLGSGNPNPERLRAVVIGAGLAGLTTAHSLAGLFDEVTLLERDDVAKAPDSAEDATVDELTGRKRPGVSQFAQPHILLKRGMVELSAMFGDFEQKLIEAGGQPINWIEDARVHNFGRYLRRQKIEGPNGSGQATGVTATRALYEATVRREVMKTKNLEFVSGGKASGLTFSSNSVTGVQLADGRHIAADLVVDASGRNSSTPAWLAAGGFEKPPEVSISANLGYGTCVYDVPDYFQKPGDSKTYIVFATPPDTRGCVLWPIEGGKYQIILSGYNGDHPPGDHEGFLEFAKSLAAPDAYEKLKNAKPLTPVMRYKRTDNFRRKYEEINMPEGLCVIGDAVAAFNPVYGQGMTVGVMQAVQLRDMAARQLEGAAGSSAADRRRALQGLSSAFHAQLPAVLDFPWTLATGEDLRHISAGVKPEGGAPASPVQRAVEAYFQFIKEASVGDPAMQLAFWKVFHMVGSPADMFAPSMVLRALRQWVLRKLPGFDSGSSSGGSGGGTAIPVADSPTAQATVAAASVTR